MNEQNSAEQSTNRSELKLTDLPTEILENIFYYLPAKTICLDVHRTCKRLYNTSRTPAFWSSYLKTCKAYEPISSRIVDAEPWKRAFCFEHEEQRWLTNKSLFRYRQAQIHYATVDAVKLHETRNGTRFAVSGARDRSLILWDIRNIVDNEIDKKSWHKTVPSAHSGWIWAVHIGADDKSVFSCGFDSALKQWEIVDGTLCPVRELRNNIDAFLRCFVEDNYLYASTHSGKITMSDIRIGLQPQRIVKLPGEQRITCMESLATSNYLYAMSSQSGKLFSVDKRQMKVEKCLKGFAHCMSMELNSESLVASWKTGVVRYLDPITLKTEYTWRCPTPSEMKSLNPLCISKGAFIYGNSYELLIYTPGRNPRLLAKLPTKEMIITVDYNNGDLVCGMSEGVITFWPRENQNFSLIDPNDA